MNLLLDTNVLIYWLGETEQYSPSLAAVIESPRNTLFYSPLNVWETQIKISSRKLTLRYDFLECLAKKDISELVFTSVHARAVGTLEPIHSDPFDRGLMAQALSEDLTLLTSDRLLTTYSGLKIKLV